MRQSLILQPFVASPTSQLILQLFCRSTHVTAHSTTVTLLHLRHSSFSNPSAALPTSQIILQPFRCFTYVIGTSRTSPGEPPMSLCWCLIYPGWFFKLKFLRPAGLYERCKLALEFRRLKTPALKALCHRERGHASAIYRIAIILCEHKLSFSFKWKYRPTDWNMPVWSYIILL